MLIKLLWLIVNKLNRMELKMGAIQDELAGLVGQLNTATTAIGVEIKALDDKITALEGGALAPGELTAALKPIVDNLNALLPPSA